MSRRTVTGSKVIEGTVVNPAEEKRARELTDKIQRGLADVIALRELIAEAFTTRAWAVLGYESWDAYTQAEFRLVSLSRDDQRALNVVLQLEEGMSSRAAAAATGTDHKTAKKDADRAHQSGGENSPPGSSADLGTRGEKRVRELAKEKGLQLYRGHAFGCWPVEQDGQVYEPYALLDHNHLHPGEDPELMDSYTVLVRITLDEAERYLTDGTIPDGHELRELGPYEVTHEPERRTGADGKSYLASRPQPPVSAEPEPEPESGPVELTEEELAEWDDWLRTNAGPEPQPGQLGLPEEVMAQAVADAKMEVARRASILAEVAHIASQPTEADRLTHALAALRCAVGELVECDPDLTKDDETRKQIEDHFHVIRGLLGGPLIGNNQHVRRERELKEHYLQTWRKSGEELDYDEVLAEIADARSFDMQ